MASPLNLQDSFEVAKETTGSYTVGPGIDGWKGNEEPLRIDYVFASQDWTVERLSVIFDGNQSTSSKLINYALKQTLHLDSNCSLS